MPESSKASVPFWRELTIQAMRLAVRIPLALGHLTHSEAHSLLRIAIYRELRERGHSQVEISTLLGCGMTTVKAWGRQSRQLKESEQRRALLNRMLRALEERPLTTWQLQEQLRTIPMSTLEVALHALERQGLVRRSINNRGERFGLGDGSTTAEHPAVELPMQAAERSLRLSLELFRLLLPGPRSRAQLSARRELKAFSPKEIKEGIERALASGAIVGQGSGRLERLTLVDGHHEVLPQDDDERLRLGFHDLLGRLAMVIEQQIQSPDVWQLGQRTLDFRIDPADLPSFIRTHRDAVVSQLKALEARATSAAVSCTMLWVVAPLPDRRL